MIGTARIRRSVLSLRASARHGDPLSPPQTMPRTLPRATQSSLQTVTLPSVIRGPCASGRASRPAIISPNNHRSG
jgi:hypothetical protein